jgi:ketosteroid isomerase-like protein
MANSDDRAGTVRRFWKALSRRDFDVALAHLDPAVEWDFSESRSPYAGIYRGHDAVRRLFKQITEAWSDFITDPHDFVGVDDERILFTNRIKGKGRGSGLELEAEGAHVWTFREGRVTRVKLYQSRHEAEAAALSG